MGWFLLIVDGFVWFSGVLFGPIRPLLAPIGAYWGREYVPLVFRGLGGLIRAAPWRPGGFHPQVVEQSVGLGGPPKPINS